MAVQSVAVHLRPWGRRPGPDRRRWVIRPDDLLVLAFDLVNLKVEPSDGDAPAKLVRDGTGDAFLIVTFPPQNLGEKSYFTTDPDYPVSIPPPPKDDDSGKPALKDKDANSKDEDPEDPPIEAVIAGWSRLVFKVRDDQVPIPWVLADEDGEGLLKTLTELELSVPANALPPRQPKMRIADVLVSALAQAELAPQEVTADLVPAAALQPTEGSRSVARGSHFLAVARGRRKLRTVGALLAVNHLTGSATRDIHEAIAHDVAAEKLPFLVRPKPAEPGPHDTSLELPYRLYMSPNRSGAWFHAPSPMTSDETGHTELWHTRLGVRRNDGTLVDGDDPLRKLRAVWNSHWPEPAYRMSLDDLDRYNFVQLSSNFQLTELMDPDTYYEPRPIDVDLLALSSLGAWLDSRGVWDFPQPYGLSVEEWRHRATLGRDHYVRVVYSGFLYPFGHRASLIKITERRFHDDTAGNTAYLRTRMFIVVREQLKTYRTTGLKYEGSVAERAGEQFDLMMPFEAVRIMTVVSPLIDPPETDAIDAEARLAFWPYVGGQPFKFHVVGTDVEGNRVDMVMPMIFVGKELNDPEYAASNTVPTKVATAYDSSVSRSTVPLQGQRLAFAEGGGGDGTTFAAQSLTFGTADLTPAQYNGRPPNRARFLPVVRKTQVDIPALQRIARTSDPAALVFEHQYLVDEFVGANAGEVFLAADPAAQALAVRFSSQGERSGALVAPDMDLSGLSRITGPVSGALTEAVNGSFNPATWFGAITSAKLFGIFELKDVLKEVGFDELDKLPKFIGESLNQVEQVIGDVERLRRLVTTNPVPETSAVAFQLEQLLDAANGSIPGLLAGGGAAAVVDDLITLKTELGTLAKSVGGSKLPPGPKALIAQMVGTLTTSVDGVLGDALLLTQFANGDILPQALNARFEWRPQLHGFGPFSPNNLRGLLLSVEAADALEAGGAERFSVTCSLDDFDINLAGFMRLRFERIQFRVPAGKKPDIDVQFKKDQEGGILFEGPLAFVETLRELIPFDGFSDPPDIEVTSSGITAGFSMGLPNLAVGVFSLENLSLAAGFNIPFVGQPLSTWFRFCERDNPARLTVSAMGGGFYFGLIANPNGLQTLDGAIEFGAAISVNFGVASGSVSAMAGLYFKIESSKATLAGYFRLRGEVEALGIVSVSIELYLEMRYESGPPGGSGKCVGTATISVEVDVALFEVTVEITCTKKFAGSGADPTFAELMDVAPDATSADWDTYCRAFA